MYIKKFYIIIKKFNNTFYNPKNSNTMGKNKNMVQLRFIIIILFIQPIVQAQLVKELKKLMNFRIYGWFDEQFTNYVEKSAKKLKLTGWVGDNMHDIKTEFSRNLMPCTYGQAVGYEETLNTFKTYLSKN